MAVNRVRVTGMDLNKMRAHVLSQPDMVTDEVAEGMRLIAADAVRFMRHVIETSSTPTGLSEGRTGRVKSGTMLNKVDQAIRVNKRNVSMRFGWLNGRPGYSIFQEHGTKNGIKAMHALTDARVQADIAMERLIRSLG